MALFGAELNALFSVFYYTFYRQDPRYFEFECYGILISICIIPYKISIAIYLIQFYFILINLNKFTCFINYKKNADNVF